MSEPQLFIMGGPKKRGRRPRADSESQPFPVRLSQAERAIVKEAARVNHQRPSEFMRDALLTAAGECLENVGGARRGNS